VLDGPALAGPALDEVAVLELGSAGAVETGDLALGLGAAQPATQSATRRIAFPETFSRGWDRM
jgi:hypothetical protein